jgi:hypothetical protein
MLRASLALFACASCFAQERDPLRDAVEWTVSLRGRMAQMENPVVRVYGTAGLAHTLCGIDPLAASGLYRDAISSLYTLGAGVFGERATTVLPVGSFSGLWKYVVPAALQCDPGLVALADNARARERMTAERNGANATLHRASDLISPGMPLDKQSMLDRAAQLAGAALEAGDPDTLDMALFGQVLSSLVGRAPDLSDDLFVRGLDFVMSEPAPSPDSLQTLAKFLFTASGLEGTPDEDQRDSNFTIGGATVEMLTATRTSANPDNIEALIETTLKLLGNASAVNRNPIVTYALAYQLLPRALDLMPDRARDLDAALAQLEALDPAVAAQVQAKLGGIENPSQESGDPAKRILWLCSQIRGALAAGQIQRARDLLPSVTDLPIRGQLKSIVDYEEGVRAIERNGDQALAIATQIRPGIKRSLLYTAYVAGAPRMDMALEVYPLAVRDIAPLPAEQRVRLLAALSAALLHSDVDSAITVLNQLVNAYNDVRVNPRRGKFDPLSVRKTYNDSATILAGRRGFYEAVQTERGRTNFPLRAPGVDAYSIAAFLPAAAALDPDRLGAIIAGLRDENTQAAAWVKLAGVRLATARTAPRRQ